MMKHKTRCALVALILAASAAAGAEPEAESYDGATGNSTEFSGGYADAVARLRAAGFHRDLISPTLGAKTRDEQIAAIKATTPALSVSAGVPGKPYDVIIQPGHFGRIEHARGASGTRVSEQVLMTFLAREIATQLRSQNLDVLVISADDYLTDDAATDGWQGLRAHAFLALHADGSARGCSGDAAPVHPMLGYDVRTSPLAMHAVGASLAKALNYSYETFARDNFTANRASYYLFRHVKADTLSGLLQIGDLSCPAVEDRLIGASEALAHNIAQALAFITTLRDMDVAAR